MHLELFERCVTKGELTLVDPSGARRSASSLHCCNRGMP
jgi:hypothetical protein